MICSLLHVEGNAVFPGAPGHKCPPPVASPRRICWVRCWLAKFTKSSAAGEAIAPPTAFATPPAGTRLLTGQAPPEAVQATVSAPTVHAAGLPRQYPTEFLAKAAISAATPDSVQCHPVGTALLPMRGFAR